MTPGSTEVRDRLCNLIDRVLGPAESLPRPAPVDVQLSDLGVSSLKMVNLMLAVEVEFGVAIPQEDITPENFHSITTIDTLVVRLLGAGDL